MEDIGARTVDITVLWNRDTASVSTLLPCCYRAISKTLKTGRPDLASFWL